MKSERIILGIDPGTNVMGYGLIRVEGKKMELIDLGTFEMKKLEEQSDKLRQIFFETVDIIKKHQPTEMAIEAPFFGKNVQSMLKLGRAQGVAIAAGLSEGLSITEYSPRKIKQSITGKGSAAKEQVCAMLETLLKFQMNNKALDASDALAAAVCHFFQNGSEEKKSYTGWAAFLKANPGKQKK